MDAPAGPVAVAEPVAVAVAAAGLYTPPSSPAPVVCPAAPRRKSVRVLTANQQQDIFDVACDLSGILANAN